MKERSAGFVLFCLEPTGERRYLLLRHRNGGHWSFAKGRIEPGEREEDAALREAREETGMASIHPVSAFRRVHCYRFMRDGRPVSKHVVYFLGRVPDGAVTLSEEHTGIRWLPFREACEKLTYRDTAEILRVAEGFLARRES